MKIIQLAILLAFGSAALGNAQPNIRTRLATTITSLRMIAHPSNPQPSSLPFTLRIAPKNRIVFNNDALHSFQGELINNTDSILTVGFQRTQTLPNSDWTTSVCFGTTCYPSGVDAKTTQIAAHDSVLLVLDVNSAISKKSDSAVTFLKIYAQDNNPADSVLLQFNSVFQPAKGVASSASTPAFAIESAWPNPVRRDAKLNLSVTVPTASFNQAAAAGALISILSTNGTRVSTSTLGRLNPGTSQLTLPVTGLASGSYFLQVLSSAGRSNLYGFTVE